MSAHSWLVGALAFGLVVGSTSVIFAADGTPLPAIAPVVSTGPATVPAARSPKELRDAVAEAIKHANSTKADVGRAAKSLVDLYGELGRDVLLPATERVRLGTQVRTRLQRFVSQIHYELAHNNSRGNSNAAAAQSGAAGPAAAEGLDSLVELIQTTIGQPDDWVAVQGRALQQAANGPALAGGIGAGAGVVGAGHGGGAFGSNDAFNKAADANGADLVDLIQKTIDPPSWDVNGGPGTIMYFNNLRVLVVRQTAENQDDVGGLLGGLRK